MLSKQILHAIDEVSIEMRQAFVYVSIQEYRKSNQNDVNGWNFNAINGTTIKLQNYHAIRPSVFVYSLFPLSKILRNYIVCCLQMIYVFLCFYHAIYWRISIFFNGKRWINWIENPMLLFVFYIFRTTKMKWHNQTIQSRVQKTPSIKKNSI